MHAEPEVVVLNTPSSVVLGVEADLDQVLLPHHDRTVPVGVAAEEVLDLRRRRRTGSPPGPVLVKEGERRADEGNLRAGVEVLGLQRKALGVALVVAIHPSQVLAACPCDASVERRRQAEVLLVLQDHHLTRTTPSELLQDTQRVVSRAVVTDDELPARLGLRGDGVECPP